MEAQLQTALDTLIPPILFTHNIAGPDQTDSKAVISKASIEHPHKYEEVTAGHDTTPTAIHVRDVNNCVNTPEIWANTQNNQRAISVCSKDKEEIEISNKHEGCCDVITTISKDNNEVLQVDKSDEQECISKVFASNQEEEYKKLIRSSIKKEQSNISSVNQDADSKEEKAATVSNIQHSEIVPVCQDTIQEKEAKIEKHQKSWNTIISATNDERVLAQWPYRR